MSIIEIVYSPTGGTQKISQIITDQWSEKSVKVDLSDSKADFSKCVIGNDDLVLVSMPLFGASAPTVAIDRLRQINGNGARCVIACVYGNGAYDNTLAEMKDAAEEIGFKVIAAIAAVAQHSIIPEYASGRPDEEDTAALRDFADKIIEKTESISSSLETHVQEEMTEEDSKPVPPSQPPLPKPGDECIECGICVENCPLDAISPQDFISNISKCNFCMRCTHQCPNQSRKVDEEVLSAATLALKDTCSGRKENELFL